MSRATQVQLREDVGIYYETLRAISDDPELMKAVDEAEQAQHDEETLFSAEDLRKVIWQETQKRVWELEREPASLSMHSRTWEDILIQEAQPGEVSYNHFRGILVIRDGRIPYGHVSIAWKKPA